MKRPTPEEMRAAWANRQGLRVIWRNDDGTPKYGREGQKRAPVIPQRDSAFSHEKMREAYRQTLIAKGVLPPDPDGAA